MTEPLQAYRLAERIHSSFFGPATNLTPDEISQTGITVSVQEPYNTEVVTAMGCEDSDIVYQNLSKSRKTGYFTLTSVFRHEGTKFTRITPSAPIETVPILASTIFMQALSKIAEARQQN